MEASTAETASMAPCTSPVVIMSRTASQRARVSHRCASAACVCAHQPSQLECLSVLRLVLSLPGLYRLYGALLHVVSRTGSCASVRLPTEDAVPTQTAVPVLPEVKVQRDRRTGGMTEQTSTSLSAAMKSQTRASSLLVFTPCAWSGEDVVETISSVACDHPSRHSHVCDEERTRGQEQSRDRSSDESTLQFSASTLRY